jgi:hypothetical protein
MNLTPESVQECMAGWPTFRITQMRLPHPFALFAKGWVISGLRSASSELALSEAEGAGFSQNRGEINILVCVG